MSRGEELNALATIVCFFPSNVVQRWVLFLRDRFTNHTSSHYLFWVPSWMLKLKRLRKQSLTFIGLDQKCESPCFHWIYFVSKMFQPNLIFILQLIIHLLSKQTFWISKFLYHLNLLAIKEFHISSTYIFSYDNHLSKKGRPI